MTPQLDKALRHGGMSRRGFLRALGVTVAAVLVPGMGPELIVPQIKQKIWTYSAGNLMVFDIRQDDRMDSFRYALMESKWRL